MAPSLSPFRDKGLLIALLAVVLMVFTTIVLQRDFANREIHIVKMAGREANNETMAQVYLSLDNMQIDYHFKRLWTYNGIIFLSGMLLIPAMKRKEEK